MQCTCECICKIMHDQKSHLGAIYSQWPFQKSPVFHIILDFKIVQLLFLVLPVIMTQSRNSDSLGAWLMSFIKPKENLNCYLWSSPFHLLKYICWQNCVLYIGTVIQECEWCIPSGIPSVMVRNSGSYSHQLYLLSISEFAQKFNAPF